MPPTTLSRAGDRQEPAVIESYVAGRWLAPAGDARPLLDAAHGTTVARFPGAPLDNAAVLRHARRVGSPALRELTFHDRAMLLKAVARCLDAAKQELYELSYATGATLKDSFVDVDGGILTAFAYSSRARRELPNDVVHVDGSVEQLGRSGAFVAQHVHTPLQGAAVQVNAYNFPVWGMLEKLAPALVAGLPTVVKPAPQTAYVTERAVRLVVEAGILPEGALQLVAAEVGDLLDQLTGQDVLAFTGSAATAARVRSHPAVIANAVRVNVEADSLNAAVLGPDAAPGTPEADLFVREVAREMTVKAGQKCTAIRRALVPRQHAGAIAEALTARLATVRVGDPRDPDTRMGALVSAEQRERVVDAVAALTAGGAGTLLTGGSTRAPLAGYRVPGLEDGAFLPPLLVRADDPLAPAVHEVEAFGPVASLVPYEGAAHAVELLARGRGSLVASLVSHDPGFVRDLVLGAAAHHGRLHVLDRDSAAESTGHGSPLAPLVHGGPGRAGGGEELGGMRGVLHLMQRTAVQGSPGMLAAATGRWVRGAARRTESPHPFRKPLAELRVGDAVVTGPRQVTQADIDQFAAFTGDTFYAHTDPAAAAANPLFGGIVAHGYLVLSFAAGMFVDPAAGPVLANTGLDRLRFVTPVRPGDRIVVALTCMEIKRRLDVDYGEVRWDVEVTDPDGQLLATYELLTNVADRWPPQAEEAAQAEVPAEG